MVTRGRTVWAAQALCAFLRQTYEPKNLFIVDDSDEPSFPDGVNHPSVSHYLLPDRLSIPAKRNIACELADGEILCNWDSDDYSEPSRLADQVSRLEESGSAVTGYHSMLFYVEQSGQCVKYFNDRSYALGTSLCFLKSWWANHRFIGDPAQDNPSIGEDNMFVRAANNAQQLVSVDAGQLMVARVHPGNTCVKKLVLGTNWRAVTRDAIPKGFFE